MWLKYFSNPNVQVTFYIGMVVFLVIFMYVYIYYLYSRQKSGHKDFEKYHNLVTKDNIDDAPLEEVSKKKKKKKEV